MSSFLVKPTNLRKLDSYVTAAVSYRPPRLLPRTDCLVRDLCTLRDAFVEVFRQVLKISILHFSIGSAMSFLICDCKRLQLLLLSAILVLEIRWRVCYFLAPPHRRQKRLSQHM